MFKLEKSMFKKKKHIILLQILDFVVYRAP